MSFNPTLVRLARGVSGVGGGGRGFCFNPTLVRLAHVEPHLHVLPDHGFNPTLVRLAREMRERGRKEGSKFQSHLGSISTRHTRKP